MALSATDPSPCREQADLSAAPIGTGISCHLSRPQRAARGSTSLVQNADRLRTGNSGLVNRRPSTAGTCRRGR